MKKCPNCRREIDDNSTFCEYCGCQIKRSKKPLWIALGAIVAVAAIVVLVINLVGRSPKVESMRFSESKKYYTFIEGLVKDAGNCDQLEKAANELNSRIFDDSWDRDEMTQAENEKLQKTAKGLADDIKKKAKKMGCDEDLVDEDDLKEWCNPTKDEDDTDWDSDDTDWDSDDTKKESNSNWESEYRQKYDSIRKATEKRYQRMSDSISKMYQ